MRLVTLPARRYAAFVSGSEGGESEQGAVNAKLVSLLKGYERKILEIVDEVEGLGREDGGGKFSEEQKRVLRERWAQIRGIVNAAVRAFGGEV